jgi:hypothetical protein
MSRGFAQMNADQAKTRSKKRLGEDQSFNCNMIGLLRVDDALFNISLPGFVISDTAFGLFASQVHFLGYIVNSLGPIFLLVEPVTGRS